MTAPSGADQFPNWVIIRQGYGRLNLAEPHLVVLSANLQVRRLVDLESFSYVDGNRYLSLGRDLNGAHSLFLHHVRIPVNTAHQTLQAPRLAFFGRVRNTGESSSPDQGSFKTVLPRSPSGRRKGFVLWFIVGSSSERRPGAQPAR